MMMTLSRESMPHRKWLYHAVPLRRFLAPGFKLETKARAERKGRQLYPGETERQAPSKVWQMQIRGDLE